MNTHPKVIAAGDFFYFAPEGKAFTSPSPGNVAADAKPGAADSLWLNYALGSVKEPSMDKVEAKPILIKAPLPGSGVIVTHDVIRPERSKTTEVTMNELSRLAFAGFYKSDLIEPDTDTFVALSGGPLKGWLKRQRYDQAGNLVDGEDQWVELDCEFSKGEGNIINPKFTFTWLYSPLAATAI